MKILLSTLCLSLLVLLSSGCGPKQAQEQAEKPDNPKLPQEIIDQIPAPSDSTSVINPDLDTPVTDFRLEVETTGEQSATFSWQVPDDMIEDIDKFMMVRGDQPNPEHPSNWYWWRGPSHRDLTWEELPTGTAHFRLCTMKSDECLEYSNSVEVTLE